MAYRHTDPHTDYSLFSPGGVFFSLPGHPAFPVRLASEMYQDCAEWLTKTGRPGPYHLYDPCCGGAYHLAVLAYLHPGSFHSISASDIEPDAVSLAQRNLSLITPSGLLQRQKQLEQMLDQFGKASHQDSLALVDQLRERQSLINPRPEIRIFQADVLAPGELRLHLTGTSPDLVITDIPYGSQSHWVDNSPATESTAPLWRMLDTLSSVVSSGGVVAVAADKAQKISHSGYRQLRRMKIGHRQVAILTRI